MRKRGAKAVVGSEAVLRLTTKIPPFGKMRKRGAWEETNLLRTEGARILVDAAIAEGVKICIHESITFVYADNVSKWITEGTATDDGEREILCSALDGEKEAARFSESGRRGIVLRFGLEAQCSQRRRGLAARRRTTQAGSHQTVAGLEMPFKTAGPLLQILLYCPV